MFAQIICGRIVRISEESGGDDVELDLPEDFDFDHIDSYEVTENGLVKHNLPAPEIPQTPYVTYYVTWEELEKALKEGVNSV